MEIEIVNYIKAGHQHGLTDQEIKQNLLDAGWERGMIEDSFSHVRAGGLVPATYNTSPLQNDQLPENTTQQLKVISTQPSSSIKKNSWRLIAAIVGLLFVLTGSAFAYYTFVLNSPEKIWAKFMSGGANAIYENSFNFSYTDPETSTSSAGSFFTGVKSFTLAVQGDVYVNNTDPKNTESKADTQYTFSSGDTKFSTGFQYLLKNNLLFLNMGQNPIIASLYNLISPHKPVDWLKLDLHKLQNWDDPSSKQQASELKEVFDPTFLKELQKTWNDSNIITIKRYIGRDKINGTATVHFENNLDKQKLQTTAEMVADKIAVKLRESGQSPKDSDIADAKLVLREIINRIDVQQFETWIGIGDGKLYKVVFSSNAPSVISAFQTSQNTINGLQNNNNDIKRISDMRQMASALELYYNDHDGYPPVDTAGHPTASFTPTYMSVLPIAPSPDGTCTDYFNSYWYSPKNPKKNFKGETVYDSYQYTFCLGSNSGGYTAGIAELTPAGIKDKVVCNEKPEICATVPKSEVNHDETIKNFLSAVSFTGKISINAIYSGYGKKQDVTPPSESLDLLDTLISESGVSRDTQRIADVRQMASAFELYFVSKGDYPEQLEAIAPTYLNVIPVAPNPPDGVCSATDNTYSYSHSKPGQFQFSFCIGTDTGGYKAGKHVLTPAGIQ